jgi:hypothetical protein
MKFHPSGEKSFVVYGPAEENQRDLAKIRGGGMGGGFGGFGGILGGGGLRGKGGGMPYFV